MMPLPQKFDENEWFVIIFLFISFALFFWLPKRIPLSITICMMLWGSIIARLFDHLLSLPFLNLYDIMDTGKYDLFDVILYLLYAPFSYFFIYVYDKLNIRGFWIWGYILACSVAATLFEGLTVVFNVFNYNDWKLPYSFSVYLVTQAVTLLIYHAVKNAHASLTANASFIGRSKI